MAGKVKQYDSKIIFPKKEKQEFIKGESGVIFCGTCGAVYYKKSWRHNLIDYKKIKESASVKFQVCPACQMIKNKQFEGEIIVENIPDKSVNELKNLINAFSKRAYEKDPLHRLINIKQVKSDLKITTTENQLAVRLARKIKETFKKSRVKISYSSSPGDTVYIKIVF